MKKKFALIGLMTVALVCLLAISVFADDIVVSKTESAEYGTVIQLNADPGLDNALQYVSTLNNIVDAGTDADALCIMTDGTYFYVFPSSYVVLERADGRFDIYTGTDSNPGLVQAMTEFNSAMGTNYYASYSTIGSGGGKRINEIVRFEFTSDVTFVHADYCCMREYPKLIEVRFNYAIDFSKANNMFQKNYKLTTVVGFEKATNPNLPKAMFMSCTALESISLPVGIEKIPSSMFWGAGKLVIENLSQLTQLTTIGSSAFQDAATLVFTLPDSVTTIETSAFQSAFKNGGSLTISPASQLVTIGESAFRDCRSMKSFYMPSTVTSIGSSAFQQTYALTEIQNFENCQITELAANTFAYAGALKSLKIPKTVTTINAVFLDNSSLTLVYIPDTVVTIASNAFSGGQAKNAVYIYTGKDVSALSSCTRFTDATIISASDYSAENTYTGINLVIGYSNCIAYNNGVHGESVSDLVVTSYLESIKIVSKCVNCDMGDSVGEIPALFSCQGFSAPENGNGGLTIGFVVNHEAIEMYTKASGKTVKYGVFAASKNKLGDNYIFTENGACEGIISFDLSNSMLSAFDLRVVGFETDVQKNVKLAMGAYVEVSNNEGTEYSYLQNSAPTQGEKYYFASFFDVLAELQI